MTDKEFKKYLNDVNNERLSLFFAFAVFTSATAALLFEKFIMKI